MPEVKIWVYEVQALAEELGVKLSDSKAQDFIVSNQGPLDAELRPAIIKAVKKRLRKTL